MYYLFSDSGELIDEYEELAPAQSSRESIKDTILLWYDGDLRNVWEHGIELYPEGQAPSYTTEFVYHVDWARYSTERSAKTLEEALEGLRELLKLRDNPCDYGITERITKIHKVKIT